jgi:7-keto-8-aminopelargonate synthetase-like enzyme
MKRDWNLQTELEDLRAQGLWRELRVLDEAEGPLVQREGRALVNFSSNDYLGLCGSAELKTALQDALQRHGAGAGASRLVCGTHRAHAQLEEALAAYKHTEAALAFSSGFSVALGVIPALVGAGDTVILDKLSHACLVDAARLASFRTIISKNSLACSPPRRGACSSSRNRFSAWMATPRRCVKSSS